MSKVRTGRRGILSLMTATVGPATAAATLDRTARIIVGLPPGGSIDITARLLAERLRGRYAPQVVVENRPGASARLAVDAVRTAPNDGTAVLLTPLPVMTLFPHVFPRTTRYDGLTDFIPVTTVAVVPYGFAVRADHPATSMAEFAAWARARGGATDFAAAVPGNPQHMLGLYLARLSGFVFNHIPYRGGAPAVQALVAGDIAAAFTTIGDLTGLHEAGTIRILAVTAAEPIGQLPAVSTMAQAGFPPLTMDEYYAVMLPAGTPAPVVVALHEAVATAVALPEMREALARIGLTTRSIPPAQLAATLRSERDRWGPLVRSADFDGDR